MFVKASKMTSVGTEDMNMFSFDPAKIPLFFFPVSEHEKTSSLPLATTLCSAARELNVVQRFRVFPIEEKGLYLIGDDKEASRFLHALQKVCKHASFEKPDSPISEGVSSGVLHELLLFSISSLLFSKGYSLILGHFCFAFNKSDHNRPAVHIKAHILDGRAKLEMLSATLRGANSASATFVPGSTRYALPHCRPCRIHDITDALNPKETLGTTEALATYWQNNYGLGQMVKEGRLFAKVVFGTNTFTYPSASLLATALSVDDKHRPGTAEREQNLLSRVTQDLSSLHLFAKRTKED